MKRAASPMFWGILLIIVGILALLQSLGLFGSAMTVIWAALFIGAGVVFLYVYVSNREQWWAIIPGLILAAIGLVILLDVLAPGYEGDLSGTLVVGAIALSFLFIYLARREFWWALIPAGVMLSVTAVTLVEGLKLPIDSGAIMLLGIGLTFAVLSFVRTKEGQRLRWALIPGGIMLLIGIFVAAEGASLAQYVLPAALLIAGLFFILRSVQARQ